jgi:cytochrome c553
MVSRLGCAVLMMGIGLAADGLADGDPDNGRKLATEFSCAHCHGPDGNARSTRFQPVPMLAGQPTSYLVKEMQNYASGRREDLSRRARMSELLRQLSDTGFEDLAAFYAAQKRY